MKFSISPAWQIGLQITGAAFQIVFPSIPGISAEWVKFSSAVVGFVQAALGIISVYTPAPQKQAPPED